MGERLRARAARWRYVVPNAITCASLVVGLVASVQALVLAEFVNAAWLVILSVLLDKLDGTAARALKATSAIGVQLDSFADFVTFGIAPGALLYGIGSHAHATGVGPWAGEVGGAMVAVVCAAYVVCACLRLAKFNVLAALPTPPGTPPGKVFFGLPSTFAGGLVAIGYIVAEKYALRDVVVVLPIIAAGLGVLMLTNLPLPKLVPRKNVVFNVIQIVVIVVVYVAGVARWIPEFMFGCVVVYALVGFTWGFIHRKELVRARVFDPYEAPEPSVEED